MKEINKNIRELLLKEIKDHLECDLKLKDSYDGSDVVILVNSDNYNKLRDFIYGDDSKIILEKYPDLYVRIEKILKNDVTDVDVGDFVAIDSQWDEGLSVGIVVSIKEDGVKKIFGCSYINIAFSGSIYSKGCHDTKIEITEEDYSGYHSGFSKKLTLKEAKEMISEKVENEYRSEKTRLKQDRDSLKETVNRMFNKISSDGVYCVYDVKKIEFKDGFDDFCLSLPKELKEKKTREENG